MGPVVGSLLGVPHLSSRFRPRSRSRDSSRLSESDAHAQSWFCLGVSDTDRLRLQRTRTRSYFHCEPGGCCLHRGHTLFPAWADTHSYTHTHTRTASFGRSETLGSQPLRQHSHIHMRCLWRKLCGIPTVTARIHSLSGIAPAPRIIYHSYRVVLILTSCPESPVLVLVLVLVLAAVQCSCHHDGG